MNHGLCPADIQIDLIGDYSRSLPREANLGKISPALRGQSREGSAQANLLLLRSIPTCDFPSTRRIHKSNRFSCPERHLGALAKIEELIVTGGDLTPYLSDDIMELKNVDAMLNVFGVHHLHLGDSIITKGKKRGFTKRTPPLLYCYFTGTNAYFIDVMDHESFGSQTVISDRARELD